jgi:hypothetical protein
MACAKQERPGCFLSETSARLSGQRGQRARKKTEAILELRIIMACTIYHVHGSVQPARATFGSRSTKV